MRKSSAGERAAEILELLRKEFKISPSEFMAWKIRRKYREPFALLIATILSQNTNDRNSYRAFVNLASKFKIKPEVLAEAEERELAEAIRIGGLYRVKAKKIKELAKEVLKLGGMDEILKGGTEEVRKKLLFLPGVGMKTADIILLFHLGRSVVPVDTHVNRVSKRLGLAPQRAGYEEVRRSLESLFDEEDYVDVHHLLIKLGRTYCRARRPLCVSCPLKNLCPSASA